MKTKVILLFSIFSVALSGQLYVPSGSPQFNTNSSSNVGIGTSSPDARLQIKPSGLTVPLRINTALLPALGGGWETQPYALEVFF